MGVAQALCDVNVWFALAVSTHQHHVAARRWLDTIETPAGIAFCRLTQQFLLRLLTTEAAMGAYGLSALSNSEAWTIYDAMVEDDRVVGPGSEPPGVEESWRAYASRSSASPKLWMDSYLAAYARSSGRTMVTTDRAFTQFDGLDVSLIEV